MGAWWIWSSSSGRSRVPLTPSNDDFAPGCAFCRSRSIEPLVVAETLGFWLVADRSPLREGHLLLIPRQHLPCFGALSEDAEAEFLGLKAEVGDFLGQCHGAPLFFEHGAGRGATSHAHLHAVAASPGTFERVAARREERPAPTLADVRAWYASRGPYLYYEENGRGHILAPGGARPGYLRERAGVAFRRSGIPRPEAGAAVQRVREDWQQFRVARGHPETELVTCFLWRGERVCLFKRSELVGSARGKWHAVSGYLPAGADPLAHALAEVDQEAALRPPQVVLTRAAPPLMYGDAARGRRWRIHAFLFQVLEGEPQLNWEHVAKAWVTPAEMAAYDCVRWLPELYAAVSQTPL